MKFIERIKQLWHLPESLDETIDVIGAAIVTDNKANIAALHAEIAKLQSSVVALRTHLDATQTSIANNLLDAVKTR